jgi:LysM repeat protein
VSAMPATELTCDSDIDLVRALRSVGVLSGFREDDPGDTPGSQRDTPGRQRDTPVAPLRLTRRGRVVIAIAAALLVTTVSLLLAGVAQATNHGPSPRAARQNLVQVTVRPGQSLWSVAESADPDQDTRAVIQQIIDLNSLNGDTVLAGQQLWVPRG